MDKILPVLGDVTGCQSLGSEELQEPVHLDHQQAPASFPNQDLLFNLPKVSGSVPFGVDQQLDQPVPFLGGNKDKRLKYFAGDHQWKNGLGGPLELAEEKGEPLWQRIKWTDGMVKVLINSVSYVGNALPDISKSDRSQSLAPIKGKWRAISNAMVERGYFVSPQQCEDKFNDLNRKYKRIREILGSSSCDVVENPALLESMDIPIEAKKEVRRILACKQLFYREMCSYHNWNRKHLPHDRTLQQTVISALKDKVKLGSKNMNSGMAAKRHKQGEDNGASSVGDTHPHANKLAGISAALPESVEGHQDMNKQILSHSLRLEEKKLQIQKQMLELEDKKIEWLKFCQKQNKKLHVMKLENELMKLENGRLLFELKNREMGADHN